MEQRIDRATRYIYSEPIYTKVELNPIQIAIPLQGVDISGTGVSGFITGLQLIDICSMEDLEYLLQYGDIYLAQLEPPGKNLESIRTILRVVRTEKKSDRLVIGFEFVEQTAELLSALSYLKASGQSLKTIGSERAISVYH